ncbi:MAG: hypothetical protein ABIS45_11270 [Burkholderiales bacterium]
MRNQLMIAGILTALAGLPLAVSAADDMKKNMTGADIKTTPASATLDLDTKQIGLIVGGQSGEGVLHYQGKDYPFHLKGLRAGAIIGVSKSNATGEVRGLNKLEDFEGNYTAAAAGAAVVKGVDASSFQNSKGVVINLKQKTTGLSLDLGVTSAEIKFKK